MKVANQEWKRSDFIFQQQLGVGKFGVVYKAIEKQTEIDVAIKVIPKNKITSSILHKRVQRQIQIHARLYHSSICRMFGYFHDERNIYMVMQYCANGNLFASVKHQKNKFSDKKIASIIKQLGQAIAFLHKRNVMHRDIKLENILFDENYDVKLTDFGCCVHTTKNRNTFCGTVEYLCPEMLQQQEYGPQIDLYCLGIVMYELFYHKSPFYSPEQQKILANIKLQNIQFPQQIRSIPQLAKDLINKLLLRKFPAKAVLQHQYLNEHKKNKPQFSFGIPNVQK